ncbi:hypothetical protein [Thiohalocapsa sp. ML1]|jgi:hypothetical protein|uniref:hypothetical protein n=1 Tax=Thiohalocapsa sp. ML1 TaxID=1431688 RepID=UPI0012E37980|nr:hypothetical protein [Thiohalocapsa sp. ML1]
MCHASSRRPARALAGCCVVLLALALPAGADPLAADPLITAVPAAAPAITTEPEACREPFAQAAAELDKDALRRLAGECRDPAVTALLRNRAEHAERLRQLKVMSGLLRYGTGNADQTRLAQCRMYTALAEAFAERMQRAHPAARPTALAELNLAYEQSIHIAERTIAGHERIVGLPTAPR